MIRLRARFSSAVATASGSTSSASPRAAGHSSAAAIDRIPDPQPRSTKRSTAGRAAMLLGHRDHQARRCVAAGPERAARIDVDHAIGRRRRRRVPARPNDEAAADAQRAEVLLPDVAPLVLVRLAAARRRSGRARRPAARRRAQAASTSADDLGLQLRRALRQDQRRARPRREGSSPRRGSRPRPSARRRRQPALRPRADRERDRELDPARGRRRRAHASAQRTMRRFASRRRRLRASRILRLRFTDGFS